MTIEEFIAQRLDADQAVAEAAATRSGDWHARDGAVVGGPFSPPYFKGDEPMADHTIVYPEGFPLATEAEHIAINNPDAVLRDIAGKRKILAECAALENSDSWWWLSSRIDEIVYALAERWKDHPEFRAEWA